MKYINKFNEGIAKQWRVELKPELTLLHPKMMPSQARKLIKRYEMALKRLTENKYKRINEKTYDAKIVTDMNPNKLLQLIEYSQIILKTNQHTVKKPLN